VPAPAEDPLVAQAFDAKKHEDLARAIEKLSSDEAAFFLDRLERALRKRKIQITGYLVAMAAWLVGMTLALAYFGTHDGFTYWVFVVPFGMVGAILYGFGAWSDRVARSPGEPRTATATAIATKAAATPPAATPPAATEPAAATSPATKATEPTSSDGVEPPQR
jgi:hypothetical protein